MAQQGNDKIIGSNTQIGDKEKDFAGSGVEGKKGPEAGLVDSKRQAEQAKIQEVLGTLDLNDTTNFTKNGKPVTGVLSEKCGFKVTVKDRDEAWAQYLIDTPAEAQPKMVLTIADIVKAKRKEGMKI